MTDITAQKQLGVDPAPAIVSRLGTRSIVLIGMMGVGNRRSGAGLARGLALPSSTPMPRSNGPRG